MTFNLNDEVVQIASERLVGKKIVRFEFGDNNAEDPRHKYIGKTITAVCVGQSEYHEDVGLRIRVDDDNLDDVFVYDNEDIEVEEVCIVHGQSDEELARSYASFHRQTFGNSI